MQRVVPVGLIAGLFAAATSVLANEGRQDREANTRLPPIGAAAATRSAPSALIDLPRPLDRNAPLVERYWDWLKAETGAPADLPFPRIDIEPLPPTVRAAFVYPSAEAPAQEMRIILAPRTIDRAAGDDSLVVLGELAHELVHYALIMAENDWSVTRPVFRHERMHHCDPEFQRLNLGIADILWQTYHSADTTRAIRHMVGLACWRDGHFLARTVTD